MGRRPAAGLRLAALLLAAWMAPAVPAAADWLVPTDGEPIETQGPWEERDGLVVFRTVDGTLASMRLSDVNLAASRALIAEGPEPKAAPEPPAAASPDPPRKAVLVLTDADVRHVDPASQPASGAADGSSPAGGGEEPAAEERLAVASWDWGRTTSPDGIEVTGQLTNRGDLLAANVGLRVVLVDREGRLLGRSSARLDRTVLDRGEQTDFMAAFPGLFDFATARFEAHGFDLVRRPEPEAEPEPVAADTGGG